MSNLIHKKRRGIRSLLPLFMILVTSHISGCATVYSSADVDGRIIDSETQKPIEGAVVVGIWQLESQGFEHYYGDAIHVVESVTDKAGRYHLEGFDARWVANHYGSLMGRDPILYILAEGYEPISKGRSFTDKGAHGTHRVSPLIGQGISLEKMGITNDREAGSWSWTVRSLIEHAGNCAIIKLPATTTLLERVEPLYNKLITESYERHANHYKNAAEECGREAKQ